MGSRTQDWLKMLQDTDYIITSNADRLKTDREKSSAISNELENILRDQEVKLLKMFSRILYLKSQRIEACRESKLNPRLFGTLETWLRVVNVNEQDAKRIVEHVDNFVDLLHFSDSEIDDLCTKCSVTGENKRRFKRATTNLINYTNAWLDKGEEPNDPGNLYWDSHDRSLVAGAGAPRSPTAFLTDRNQTERRSVSESGVDSGASDSGVGSNVSQTSLPTATPPPSPGFLTAPVRTTSNATKPNKALDWGARAAEASRAPTRSNKVVQSSTPPPTHKWDTHLGPKDVPATERPRIASMPGLNMTRSRSHESNLPNRVLHAEQSNTLKPSTLPFSRSEHDNLGQTTHTTTNAASVPAASQLVSPDGPSVQSPSSALLSPTSPSVFNSTFGFDSMSRSGSTNTFGPPKSPRTGRMMHAIPHQWTKIFLRNATKQCHVCRKALAFRGEKCSSCRIRVHTDCKSKLGENTCGLTKEHLRYLLEQLIVDDAETAGVWHPSNISGSRSMPRISERSVQPSSTFVYPPPSTYPESMDSSSSTNSSAPSTPAQFNLPPVTSPFPAPPRKFTFPDADVSEPSLLPHIVLSEDYNDENVASQGSDLTVVHSQGSTLAGSERTLPNDEEGLTDSMDSQDPSLPHKLSRDAWSMHTLRGLSGRASWTDVTIPFDEIKFGRESLIGYGRFGEVHKGYWHQDVAVKLLNMDHVDDDQQLETFKHEVTSFKNTRHENIVLFLGCCLERQLGIVMNLCKGRTLHEILHRGREKALDMNRIINMAAQVTQGMSYLHTKNILHKDLRTKNIFCEPNNKVVITDFGLFSVRRLWKLQENHKECKTLHVPEHWLCYLAPEIMRSLSAHSKGQEDDELPFSNGSDVYAFGTVWYELLTSEFPFNRYPPEAIVWQVGRGVKPALTNIQAAREIKDILMQCWAYNPEERPDFNRLFNTLERLPRKRLARSPSHPVHLSRSAESMF